MARTELPAVRKTLPGMASSSSPQDASAAASRSDPPPVAEAIAFLRSKGVLDDDEAAVTKFASLLAPSTAPNVLRRNYYDKSQSRLLRLYSTVKAAHEVRALLPPPGAHTFSDAEFPGYESLLALHSSQMCMQRWQQSRLCYMHAPVIVQYHAIWHTLLRSGAAASSHGVLDVARYIAEHFSAKQLEQHVFDDNGGSSVRFLRAILEPGSVVIAADSSRFKECLALYGPGLVSGFEVHTDFKDESVHKHHGLPVGDSLGQHAIVLMGVRSDPGTGEERFILQNWSVGCHASASPGCLASLVCPLCYAPSSRWLRKQFVEVSPSYLEACDATVYFDKTPQASVPAVFSRHASTYHWQETEADMPEGDAFEDL